MLRKQRRQSAALVVLALTALAGAALAASPATAAADVSDGTLTVLVNRDEDGDASFDSGIDPPQPGIEIAVTDAAGASVRGITDDDGRFVLAGTDQLAGGQYLVTAAIPPNLSELTPVPSSDTFVPARIAVDVRTSSQTLRMGVAPKVVASAEAPAPNPTLSPPTVSIRPPRFAVGDQVWRDVNRSGLQERGEPPAARISVQLLDVDGKVVESTVSSATGRFAFDDLPAGTYAIRFAGMPSGFRLTAAGAGSDRQADSDPDATGTTAPFTLDAGEPDVRPAAAADGVRAAYIHTGVDAGIIPLRYAIGDRVWLDANADGIQQPDEPAAAAAVSLLVEERVVATTTTDAQGRYRFGDLEAGQYRVRFTAGEHRRFTARYASSDPVSDSDPDPRNGITSMVTLGPGAPDLVPAGEFGATDADLVNPTVNAGFVGAYAVGDTVWRDENGNGVLDAGDGGVPGVGVALLDEDLRMLDRTVTSATGRFRFHDLTAGTYRLRFSPPADEELVFTSPRSGPNTAVDSDPDAHGLTAPVLLGEENPDDTTIDAGLTTPANVSPAGAPAPVPVDTQLSATGGVAVSVPIAGLALVTSGLSCLLAARRPTLPAS